MVRRIFAMTLTGYGPYQIATWLTQDKVEIPSVHLARFNKGVNRTKPVKDIYGWSSSTIVHILKKREYWGHTVNFKTHKHFWPLFHHLLKLYAKSRMVPPYSLYDSE